MAKNQWIGNARVVQGVKKVVPVNVEMHDQFALKYQGQTLTVKAEEAAVDNVCRLLVAAITDATTGAWAKLTAALHMSTADSLLADYILVTGPDDGGLFTLTPSTTDAVVDDNAIRVAILRDGVPGLNMKQRITLPGPPTGGTFTMGFEGQTSIATAYNALAATVQANLEGLSTIGSGNVLVTENGVGDWTVEFIGALAYQHLSLLVLTSTTLTGGFSAAVSPYRQGKPVNYARGPIYTLTLDGEDLSAFCFRISGESGFPNIDREYLSSFVDCTGDGPTAEDIRTAIESIRVPVVLSDDDATNDAAPPAIQAVIRCDVTGPEGGPFTITIREALLAIEAGTVRLAIDTDTIQQTPGALGSSEAVTLTYTSAAVTTAVNEVQYLALTGLPNGGTYTLSFRGVTTGNINHNAIAGTVQTALEGLATIGGGNVSVTGSGPPSPNTPYLITFQSALAATGVQLISGDGSLLTGATLSPEIVQEPALPINEQQQVYIDGTPSSGTLVLQLNGESAGTINWNATALEVQTALEAMTTPGPGDFKVTGGPFPGSAMVVEFTGTLAGGVGVTLLVTQSLLVGDNDQDLDVFEVTAPTGPADAKNAANWSLGTRPADGEDLYFSNSSRPMRYNLDFFSNITPASITIDADYTGQIGLPDYDPDDGFFEERPKSWRIGNVADATTMQISIGRGEGNGSDLLRFDFGTCPFVMNVTRTGEVLVGSRAAVQIVGGTSGSSVNVYRGTVSFAMLAGEAASVGTIRMAFIDEQNEDAAVYVGPGTTVATIIKNAGYLELWAGPSSAFEQLAGDTDFFGTAAIVDPKIRGGKFKYQSSGNLNGSCLVSGDGQLIFDGDGRAKTIANPIDVYGNAADVYDQFKVATTSGESPAALVIDYNETTRNPTLGTNYRLKRLATA